MKKATSIFLAILFASVVSYAETDPPYLDTFSIDNSVSGISVGTNIFSVHVKDDGAGVDTTTITINCTDYGGSKTCASGLTCTGIDNTDITVVYGISLAYDNVVSCTIDADDLEGTPNSMDQYNYQFTVESDPSSSPIDHVPDIPNETTIPSVGRLDWRTIDAHL